MIEDAGKLQQAFELVFKKTGRREATEKELIDALRATSELLEDKSDEYIKMMIERHVETLDADQLEPPEDGGWLWKAKKEKHGGEIKTV